MQSIPSSYVDGCLPLCVAVIGHCSSVHQKYCSRLVRLQSSTVEEGIPRTSVEGIWVGASLNEPGSEGVIVFADVLRGEVGGVQLLQGQP